MKYEIGDKVRIREDLNEHVGRIFDVVDDMSKYKGRECEIIFKEGNRYRINLDGGKWSWSDEMIEGSTEMDKEDSKPQSVDNGGSTSYYALPKGAKDIQDLIEYKDMNFSLGNILKACYRLGNCDHSDRVRDLNKIIWFAERELELALREG
jgi:hypothetical protein